MLPEFYTEPRELPWQPKLCKNKTKIPQISVQLNAIETMFACIVRFSGSENSNMLIKILGEQRELP